mmetsp:Transcript_64455/g.124130  ORF Transcript_64455/g.124130 Transcript_64455/m.124130 type:complete len:212 (+) Transcript_64455:513-1148(+)
MMLRCRPDAPAVVGDPSGWHLVKFLGIRASTFWTATGQRPDSRSGKSAATMPMSSRMSPSDRTTTSAPSHKRFHLATNSWYTSPRSVTSSSQRPSAAGPSDATVALAWSKRSTCGTASGLLPCASNGRPRATVTTWRRLGLRRLTNTRKSFSSCVGRCTASGTKEAARKNSVHASSALTGSVRGRFACPGADSPAEGAMLSCCGLANGATL